MYESPKKKIKKKFADQAATMNPLMQYWIPMEAGCTDLTY